MDGMMLRQFRDALLSRRDELGGGINRERENLDLESLAGHQSELVDIAQALEQIDRDQSLAEQERKELVAIEHALAKLAMGSFGVCEDCEEEIPSRRLMIVPEARLCARCQAFEEKTQSKLVRNLFARAG